MKKRRILSVLLCLALVVLVCQVAIKHQVKKARVPRRRIQTRYKE